MQMILRARGRAAAAPLWLLLWLLVPGGAALAQPIGQQLGPDGATYWPPQLCENATHTALVYCDSTSAVVPFQGAPATGVSAPAGATGVIGWLSAIYLRLGGTASSGTDASGSAPSIANVLSTFTVSNPGQYFVQNQSAVQIQVIFDNGSGTPTIMLLASGGTANGQGGDTSVAMPWFVGRIRVAGPAGSQFAAIHN